MESVILEEDIDENYEPTEAEIEEYAQWLGMVSLEDDDLAGLRVKVSRRRFEHWKVHSYTPTPSLPFKKVAHSLPLPACCERTYTLAQPCKTNDGEV